MSPIDQIINYIESFLEVPHPVFNGLPPCPFAKRERLNDSILYYGERFNSDGPSLGLLNKIRDFDANSQMTTFLAYDTLNGLSVKGAGLFAQQISDALSDIEMLAIPIHPDDDFNVNGLKTRKGPFTMMLIQRRSILDDAKQKLLKTSYYDNWDDGDERCLTEIQRLCDPVFFPLLWWTDKVIEQVIEGHPKPEPIVGSTVDVMTISNIPNWFERYGCLHDWECVAQGESLDDLQQEVNDGAKVLLTQVGKEPIIGYLLSDQESNGTLNFIPPSAGEALSKNPMQAKFWIHKAR